MTFLEAAIAILRQAGKPLHVRELTERAIKTNLLSHLGRAPEATMRTRLTQETKKGGSSPLVLKSQDVFGLRQYPAAGSEAPAAAEPETESEGADGEEKKRRRRRGGRGRKRPGAAEGAAPAGATVEAGTPEEAIAAEQLAAEADHPEPQAIDLDALQPVQPPRYPRVVDLPAEEILTEQYADEIADGGGVQAAVEGEVVDEKTADEDRPMLAEITEGRDRHRGGRKERARKEKRKDHEKKRPVRPEAAAPAPAPPPPPAPPSPPAAAIAVAAPPPPSSAPALTPEGTLADVALHLLRSLNDPRPVHARQLAAMALKRKLLTGDPEEVWRAIRSALAGDARARQAQGLRIRARHQGGGLFTLTTARLEDEVRAAEDALATVWRDVARATREALRRRATRLSLGALEQMARIYLEHAGVTAVERVKRVNETFYLSGSGKRGVRPVKLLIAVRAGGGEVGRNAVGELRAGVEAKKADEGLLLSPARLDADAMRELEAPGKTVIAHAGDAFSAELIAHGVGVVRTHLPIAYLDIDLLAELSEG